MTSCCRAHAAEDVFGPRLARRDLKRYRSKGLGALERRLFAGAAAEDLDGARVLEIGGGIGTLQLELLRAGAAHGEVVELVSAYEPFARELAREHGVAEKSSFRVEDLLASTDETEPAEIVVLNRVVCCSPDGVALTGVAARLTKRVLVLSFPRDRALVRAALRAVNASMRVFGRSFRVFVHRRSSLLAAAEAEGLRLTEAGNAGYAWEFVTLRRAA